MIDLYNNKYAKPGLELMAAAKPLLKPANFSNKIDWIWFELWRQINGFPPEYYKIQPTEKNK